MATRAYPVLSLAGSLSVAAAASARSETVSPHWTGGSPQARGTPQGASMRAAAAAAE